MLGIGTRVGDFVLQEVIAQHGRASVYRAHQMSVDRDVTIKFIRMDPRDTNETFQERFLAKAGKTATLEGLHILPVYAYGILDDSTGYIVMRYMRSGTLESLLQQMQGKPLDFVCAEALFLQMAGALAFAHRHGVIHGSFKPSNVLLDEKQNVYVSDFGVSSIGQPQHSTPLHVLNDRSLAISSLYLAPEQLRGEPSDARADVYALGAVMYQVLTGVLPFNLEAEESAGVDIIRLLTQSPVSMRQHRPEIPEAVDEVIMRALAKSPLERFASTELMVIAFTAAMRELTGGTHLNDPMLEAFGAITMEHPVVRSQASLANVPRWLKQRTRNSARVWLALVLILMAWLAVLSIMLFNSLSSPKTQIAASVPAPNILFNVHGTRDDTVPRGDEIAQAREAMGSGFIAYIACRLDSETQAARAREMSDLAREYGLDFNVYDSEMSDYRQSTLVEQARAEGAKGIILCLLSSTSLDTLAELQSAGIPLVYTSIPDTLVGGVGVGVDTYEIGRQAAQLGVDLLQDHPNPNARIAVFGMPSIRPNERMRGIIAGLEAALPNGDYIGVLDGSTREEAAQSMRELLERGERPPDVIVAFTDSTAYGLIDALIEADIPPNMVQIVSSNGETLARSYIEQGQYLVATINVNREQGSRAAFDTMVRLIAGAEMPQIITLPPGEVIRRGDTAPS